MSDKKSICTGNVKDMYNGKIKSYPLSKKDLALSLLRYDFHFTKDDEWYYISSTDNIKLFRKYDVITPVEKLHEKWRIVDTRNGCEIVETNVE